MTVYKKSSVKTGSENKAGIKSLPCLWRKGSNTSDLHFSQPCCGNKKFPGVFRIVLGLWLSWIQDAAHWVCLQVWQLLWSIFSIFKVGSKESSHQGAKGFQQQTEPAPAWGSCASGNKARAEARGRAGHWCRCRCSRNIIWKLTAAKLALRVAKLVGFFWKRWQKVAKGTSSGNSLATGLKQSQMSTVIVLVFSE